MRAMSVSALWVAASAVSLCLLGCSTDVGGATGGSNTSPACSVTDVTGSIAGVSISIQSDHCVYSMGEPAVFTYQVKTDASVPTIEIMASMGCGSCNNESDDPLSFVTFGIGGTSAGGAPQNYCLCDTGCCAPDQAAMIKVQATTSSGTIQWSGRNWQGPSDTGNPEGAFFSPGKYDVSVTFNGYGQGSVTAKLPIEVVP